MTRLTVALPAARRGQSFLGAPRRARRVAIGRSKAFLAFWIVIVLILVLPIAVFLAVAISPALLDQGPAWLSVDAFARALTGPTLRGFLDSIVVAVIAAAVAAGVGFGLAWILLRTDAPLRGLTTGLLFALFLTPSYLIALGWERLLEPNGVLQAVGFDPAGIRSVIYGPIGVALILAVKGIPFAYLTVSNALRGLGREYDDAVRAHGGGPLRSIRMTVAMLAPAIWSALAIVFAESISDYGVAATLANSAHFPVATSELYNAVEAFPVDFPLASAISWLLLLLVVVALWLQNRALNGRSFQVFSGRARQPLIVRMRAGSIAIWLVAFVTLIATSLGVPVVGAVSASLIDGLGSISGSHAWNLHNYQRVLVSPELGGPLVYSAILATICASAAVVLALMCARVLATRGGSRLGRLLDTALLGAVALPGIVFAAGYIFAYNLPIVNALGIRIYGTSALLLLAYLATALPSTTRLLVGAMSQQHDSMSQAARVHGAGSIGTWLRVSLPILARPLLSAWLLTYSATLLELPVSQLLAPPGSQPISVGITVALNRYDYGGGTAMEILAILSALAIVAIAYGLFHLLAPRGWKRIGVAR
ncbi:iron ABC transporter permease [Pseudolysinimonas kribbensis]|uniref:ABC transporter permease n=1 Tax=Pseudolysinimonas kribbensis TaxID=433641 RepID=A0ABQ6K407_9MICO|nr:ABC transporter permease subunit [Pseudolysinimonas kribbensis]GMA94687.1 ABC transporter permease [Pseudolysinimonas kribbensis]